MTTEKTEKVLKAIPKTKEHDRLLLRLFYATGMRISTALTIRVDDLGLTVDDEHVTVAQTTLRYADQRGATADAEIRTWRRRRTTDYPKP